MSCIRLKKSGRPTAASHIREALQELSRSRRPKADLTGSIYHAMGALEAVARDLSGEPKATLGEVMKRIPGLLPKPLDTTLAKLWDMRRTKLATLKSAASQAAKKAELLVGVAAVVATYLTKK